MQALIKPSMLKWARKRARLNVEQLAKKYPKNFKPEDVLACERGHRGITISQARTLAKSANVPFGLLFFSQPPKETMPIPDYRSVAGQAIGRPSAELLDTLWDAENKQTWYRKYLQSEGAAPLAFIGSASLTDSPKDVAADIKKEMRINSRHLDRCKTWEEKLSKLIALTEDLGIVVLRNGVVDDNTHKPLSVKEFRGFVLTDTYAPFVFLNGKDAKAAQMFTLIHELAHLWLGKSALPDTAMVPAPRKHVEKFCNQVAADFLVPEEWFRRAWKKPGSVEEKLDHIARELKVSRLVVLIRAFNLRLLSWSKQKTYWQKEMEFCKRQSKKGEEDSGGGNYYHTKRYRVSDRFSRAVIANTLEDRTSYRDAFNLLGIKNGDMFKKYAEYLEKNEPDI